MFKTTLKSCAALIILTGGAAAADTNLPGTSRFTYSYVEGAFMHDNLNAGGVTITDRDGIGDTSDDNFGTLSDATGSGAAGRLSVALPVGNSRIGLHAVMDYGRTSHQPGIAVVNVQNVQAAGIVDAKQSDWRFALGLHGDIGPGVSLFAELGLVNSKVSLGTATLVLGQGVAEADLSPASGSRSALDAKIGLRAMVSERIELTGYARYHGNGRIVAADNGSLDFSGRVKAGAGAYFHASNRFAVGADYEFGEPGRLRLVGRLNF